MTLDEKISDLRDELHKSIGNDEEYDVIYNLSIELDKLIILYYNK